jgi:hypothetical protein
MSERLMDSAVSRGLFPITFPLDGERQRIGVHAKNKIAPTLIPSTTLRTGSPPSEAVSQATKSPKCHAERSEASLISGAYEERSFG